MKFFLNITPTAKQTLKKLKENSSQAKHLKAVTKALKYLLENPRYPSLQTHEYYSLAGPHNEKIFEVYAEQDTPAAYRIFFYYGAQRGEIVVFAIAPHS